MLGACLLAVCVAELAARAGFAIKDWRSPTPRVDPRLIADGYGGAPWVAKHFQEYDNLVAEWRSYVNIRLRPTRGETINVLPGGIRQTWRKAEGAAAGSVKIWFFGGSGVWGLGARDDFTIPSMVAKELDARGIEADVTNFGEIGYVSTQEFIWLSLMLRAGERPDLVVFCDGANDILAALQDGAAGSPQNEANRRRMFDAERSPFGLAASIVRIAVDQSALKRLADAISARLPGGGAPTAPTWAAPRLSNDALAESVLDVYESNAKLIDALAKGCQFETLYFWQPVLFTKEKPTAFEQDELRKYAPLRALYVATYGLLRQRAAKDGSLAFVHDVSGLFDKSPTTDFSDFCHTTEAANARIAMRVTEEIARRLRDLAGMRHERGRWIRLP